jgi:hypothetical protein
VTPTLSVDAVQDSATEVGDGDVPVTLVGTEGAVVSAGAVPPRDSSPW